MNNNRVEWQHMKNAKYMMFLFMSLFFISLQGKGEERNSDYISPSEARYKIKKSPTFKTKPMYCLIAFGAEKKKMWLVIDGDRLYLDLNGNGDLSEEAELFAYEKGAKSNIFFTEFKFEDENLYLKIQKLKYQDPKKEYPVRDIYTLFGKYKETTQIAYYVKPNQDLKLAPIYQFGGPISVGLAKPDTFKFLKCKIGETVKKFSVSLQTMHEGLTRTEIPFHKVKKGLKPMVEFTFKNADGGKPIIKKYFLEKRC